MRRNEIATQLLMVWESGDSAIVNAEHYERPNVDYNDIADKFIAGANEIFEILPKVASDQYQFELYEIGKRHFGTDKNILRLWFKSLYTIFFGKEDGPRMGEFIEIYGLDEFLETLRERCENPLRF